MSDALSLTPFERVARARADLHLGLAIGVVADGQAWLVLAAECAAGARGAALLRDEEAVLVLSRWRAETLKIRVYDTDLARLPLAPDTSPDRIRALIDPAGDLDHPMMGPFTPLRSGPAIAARTALRVIEGARLLPAVVMAPVARLPQGISRVAPGDLSARSGGPGPVVSARLPMAASARGRLHVFRPDAGGDEHYAVEIGSPDRSAPVLTRLHSACFTGDVLGSLKCDCGPQLHAALDRMAQAGGGVLLYLNQEGRGIGLANKMRAYALQDQGFDTVEANHRLGFDDDLRDFTLGARILREMRIGRVRLMTNNPRKMAMLQDAGIEVVERVPLWVGETPENRDYLRVKHERSGHLE